MRDAAIDGNAARLPAPPGLDGNGFARATVWLANSSADVAIDVASRLEGLDLDVRVWPESLPDRGRDVCRGGLAPGALRRVRAAIDERLAEPITLAELACLAGLSTCHFARAFKQSMAVPPHRYIVERRVAAAARLVRQTAQPLTDIALAVGFSDHSHFTRMFVRVTGETPRACRRRHR